MATPPFTLSDPLWPVTTFLTSHVTLFLNLLMGVGVGVYVVAEAE